MTKLSFILLSGPGSGALHTKALRALIQSQLAELPGVDMGDAECGGWLPLWVCVVWVGEEVGGQTEFGLQCLHQELLCLIL